MGWVRALSRGFVKFMGSCMGFICCVWVSCFVGECKGSMRVPERIMGCCKGFMQIMRMKMFGDVVRFGFEMLF